ncbi:MAG TPA: ADP/ATP-dependent (S)-NAD(P)H-hydrate dehydratase, partial [Verrucomicrobiae bacterium]|nr:ADP/ATP-dependent (S)-NAD(P)H-hydrate dehydratase [Verrucomicrobiae bacterium]
VTLFTREEVYSPVASQLQAVMVNGWKANLKFPETVTAILFGPGLHAPGIAEEMKPMLRKLWRDAELPVVVDASALDWLAPHILPDDYVRVVTPHPGEAARLLNWPTAKVQANRVGAVREISRQYGNCWVVLKGHQTVIGRSRGEVHVNSSGNPHLAQGGSGDVLSGFLAGLAAQPELQKDLGQALRFAAWQHGAAADELQASRRNWVVEDLVEQLGGL